ncbi:MAG TPA: DUF4350 domain-containing protein [Alcanivorax sp.]|nr:DUF4350 domain-containing protein [Alcanivorax sp.]
MSRRRGKSWGALALMLTVAALVFYFWATEPVRYMAPASPDASVRGNPYLAAQTLLEDWQRPTRRIFSTAALFPLPDTDTTLILDEYRGELGSDRIAALFEWVQRGGHLIVAARPAYHYVADEASEPDGGDNRTGGTDDPLLTPLGIHAESVETDSEDDPFTALLDRFQPMESLFLEYCLGDGELPPQCETLTCEAPPLPAPATLITEDGERRHLLAAPGQTLRHGPTDLLPETLAFDAANADGGQMMQLFWEEGRITVLAGLTLWDNQHLHYFDHAWLLKRLTGDGPVWFVQGIDMPPLPLWLWQHAWPPILALLLALAAWLWRRLPRPGPQWRAAESGRTDYLGHLLALGHFHWRTGQSERLTAALRDSARRRLDLLHPDRDKALAIAAERLALSETELRDALENGGGDIKQKRTRDRQQWTHRVAILQTLRSRL